MRRSLRFLLILFLLILSLTFLVQAKTPQKALISGVPRYYQLDMRVGGSCWFPSGCGPVAGAAVCAWWDKRGFPNLINDWELEADGLPQQAIEDLGAFRYMNRDTSCVSSWVLPGNFQEGLEEYMNEHLGTRADVARFEVFRYRITDTGYEMPDSGHTGSYEELFEIVRNEIWNGRPMVYLFRWDGDQNDDETFKVADHYGVVVGYDQTGGSRRVVIQGNQSNDANSVVSGYQNVYIGSNRYLRLGDHTKNSAVVKYHLYAIRPIPSSTVELGFGAGPLLLDDALVDNTEYIINGNDGVSTTWFEPKLDQSSAFLDRLWHDNDNWGKTEERYLQEGICFVAGWRSDEVTEANAAADSDGDGIADEYDKPDFEPVYVRTHVDTISDSSVKVTLFVELRNLGQSREPYYGDVEVRWEHVHDAGNTGPPKRPIQPPAQGSGPQMAANPLYPDTSTEAVTYAGQSTLTLEHSWLLDRDAWEASDGFADPFAFTIEVDPDDDVSELNESNNSFRTTLGSWSQEIQFNGPLMRIRQIHVSPSVRERMVGIRTPAWGMTPVDASVIGDADFFAIGLGSIDQGELADALSNADQGDLFTVTVTSAGVVFVDVAH